MTGETASIPDRFVKLDSCLLSDAMDDLGINDQVITTLTPLCSHQVAIGQARTVEVEEAEATDESLDFTSGYLDAIEKGTVLVVSGFSDRNSHMGGLFTHFLKKEGVNGAVIDGGYRDVEHIRSNSFPAFGSAHTPISGKGRVRVSSVNEPIVIDGVTVNKNDIILADATGVVVVPSDDVNEVKKKAEEIFSKEYLMEKKIEAGEGWALFSDT